MQLGCRDRDARRGARRHFPIHAYVGANGSGKTLAMVHDTLPSLMAGRTVLSTVELIDPRTGRPWPSYQRLTDWPQLLEAHHADVLFDEVVGIASSRESSGLPVQVANILNQLRRRDICLRWTAPAWARADKIIRETSQAVTLCSGKMSEHGHTSEDGSGLWRPHRLFRWRTFDATSFEEFSLNKATTEDRRRLDSICGAWFWRPRSLAERCYRTLDDVSRVGEVLDTGRCAYCGGRRRVPICHCDDHEAA